MLTVCIRHLVARRFAWWCLFGVLLAAVQPFIAAHFRNDGWEDEPGFRIRSVSASTLFEPDNRADHPNDQETTLFVSSAASIDLPNALQHGIDDARARMLMLLPLTVAMATLAKPVERVLPEPVPTTSGAPPPTTLWRRQPPETAPPLTA